MLQVIFQSLFVPENGTNGITPAAWYKK